MPLTYKLFFSYQKKRVMEYRVIETFRFLLDTCLEKPESNETWTVAEMIQYLYLTSEDYSLAT